MQQTKTRSLTAEQKEDRKLRRMFEREFRNYLLDFTRHENHDSYATYTTELCYTGYKFGYTKGKRHAR
jgi:hypothetical protein